MLYADKVTAADDSQLESMRLQLLDAQSSRIAAQSSAKHMRKCSHKARQQAAKLRVRLYAHREMKHPMV